jgi:uncharacterized protein DUF5610
MSLHSIDSSVNSTHTLDTREKVSGADETTSLSQRQVIQREQNVAILQAHQDVSISFKSEPLALVYQAAIDAINKELEPELGENSIQRGYESGIDVSPEATADRIVSFSTGLFSLYQQQHPKLSEQEQLDRFLDVIGGGIDQGFGEAREILDGLGVLEGDIADNIDKTYDLVQEGLAAFRQKLESVESNELVE